jgi:hypothetical protein
MVANEHGERGTEYGYVVHDGVAEIGLGDVGERVGGGAVVCADNTGIYVLDDAGRCTRRDVYGELERSRCGFRRQDGAEVFFFETSPFPGHAPEEKVLPVDGWRIGRFAGVAEDGGRQPWFRRYPDQAAARAVIDADALDNDPLVIATAAGGKVGDTSTIAGLVATYAAGEIADGTVRTTAVVVFNGDGDWLQLADRGHLTEPVIRCALAEPSTAAEGSAVTVEGTVESGDADWTEVPFSVPMLSGCRVVPAD